MTTKAANTYFLLESCDTLNHQRCRVCKIIGNAGAMPQLPERRDREGDAAAQINAHLADVPQQLYDPTMKYTIDNNKKINTTNNDSVYQHMVTHGLARAAGSAKTKKGNDKATYAFVEDKCTLFFLLFLKSSATLPHLKLLQNVVSPSSIESSPKLVKAWHLRQCPC